jgi:hypothetical protein
MTLELDARVITPTPADTAGPLPFAPLPTDAGTVARSSHVRVAAPLIAALADAFANGGRLESSLNEAIAALPAGASPIRIRGLHLVSPLLLERGPPGAVGWSMADVVLDAPLGTNPGRTIRVFATGSVNASLAADHRSIRTQVRVANVTASCREQDATGWQFTPCLSDVISAGVDIPQRINRALAPMDLFGGQLGALTGLSFQGVLAVDIIPQTLVFGDASGVPSVIATADVRFSVHDRAPSH